MAKAPRSKKKPAQSPAEDTDFVLHSLQDALEKKKRYDASQEQMLHFYEQMLLIRRFEERAGQLAPLRRAHPHDALRRARARQGGSPHVTQRDQRVWYSNIHNFRRGNDISVRACDPHTAFGPRG